MASFAEATQKRIDAVLTVEREINGLAAEARVAARAERSRLLIDSLQSWLREQRRKLSSKADLAKAIDYMLKRAGHRSRRTEK